MSLAAVSVRRYVFAAMLNALIVLMGLVAYDRIGVERLPNIDLAKISVQTFLEGANPEIVDTGITNVIEGAISSVSGVDQLVSTTSAGQSTVTPTFQLGKDIDVAFNEVQAKVSRIARNLPEDADPPIIDKTETGAFPSFWVSIYGDRTIQQLNQYIRTVIKKRIETVDGVGEVVIGGDRERTIRVDLDFERLAAYGITVQDVTAAFRNEHFQLPGGYLVGADKEELLKLDLEYHDPEDLKRLVVGSRGGTTIYLRDVATRSTDSLSDARRLGRYNGQPGVSLGVIKIAGRNTVEINNEIKRRIRNDIVPNLPPGIEFQISSDDSVYILDLIASLEEHLVDGALFAALVVWLFLRNFRATLIVASAIPVSLLGAVLVMYFLDYSLNTITMLGLLVLIGVVVDDAIVVLENIQRRVEEGQDRVTASMEGAREVQLAIVASTLVIACIFAAVVFVPGIPGKLIGSFGVVVAVGVLASLFVSLTLTPMLCSRFLRVEPKHGRIYKALTAWLNSMESGYRRAIGWSLAHRWRVVLIAALVIFCPRRCFSPASASSSFPPEDEGPVPGVTMRTPTGISLAYGDERVASVIEDDHARAEPDIESIFVTLGGGRAGSVNQGN